MRQNGLQADGGNTRIFCHVRIYVNRTCYALLHFKKSECALLGFVDNNVTEYLEKQVEPTSTYINLVKTIMESIMGSVLCLFIAPWSDRFGRKPVLVLGTIGGTVALCLHIVFAAVESLTPWFLLVLSVPVLVTGGGASFVAVLSAYLTDITTKEERVLRMGIFDVIIGLAVLLGNTLSSYLLISTSYVMVYCSATCCHLVAAIYTIFFIPESLRERESENQIAGFFTFSNLKETLKTPFKPRENSKRTILLLVLSAMLIGFLGFGSSSLFFFFVREKLHWELTKFTWFGTVRNILGIIGATMVIYVLHTKLKITESILILVGSLFSVASLVITGLAVKDWQIYLGAIVNLPSSGGSALIRSLITKLVHEEEIAKVLSIFSIGTDILNPVSSIMYTTLYNATINTNPGFYNFFTALISFCSALMFVFVIITQRKSLAEHLLFVDECNEDIINEPEQLSANERT